MRTKLILLLCVFASSVSSAQTALNLNLAQGKEYRQHTEMKMNMSQSFGGQTMDIIMLVSGEMKYVVMGVTPTGYNIDVTYESMSMEMQMPQATMKFSSVNPSTEDMFSQVLAAMTNKPFQVELSKAGKVISVKNVRSLFESAFDKFPNVTAEQKAQVMNQLDQSYGEKSFAANMEMMFAIYPDKPVKVGEKWTIEGKLKSSITANISSTYEYVEDGTDFRKIKGTATITADDTGEYTKSNGVDLKFSMNGTMLSDIKVDKKTGWVLEAKVTQDITGEAHVKANEQMPDGMSIPMTIKTEITNKGK